MKSLVEDAAAGGGVGQQVAVPPGRRRSGFLASVRYARYVFAKRPLFAVGYAIVLVMVGVAVLAPLLTPYSPVTANPDVFLQPPSWRHPLGTDPQGMDILARIIYAPRIDLTIAVVGTAISALVGVGLGLLVGYFSGTGGLKGLTSEIAMRVADVVQAFPVFILAIALVAILGQSIINVIYAIAFVNIPIYLRLMRSQVLSLNERPFVEASRVIGNPDRITIFRHILPNAMAPALAQLSVNIGWGILLTAGLSFVGAGVRVPTPEWGSMIAMGFPTVATGQWWPSVFPGLAIAVTVLGFALVAESCEVLLDPKQRRALG